MKAIGVSNPYMSGKVYIIWEIPHDKINAFEIYRDENIITSSLTEEGMNIFVPPTIFDHDHHTNHFKKDSTYKLMYIDEDVSKYQHYKYKVIALRVNENGDIIEKIQSNTVYIEAQ